ncbi:hypothetical protein [Myroides injenensis]|uniref:hypothetical protein n=1 Tax=Myroides injenensis TaxID=1183151 RepID=UPI000288C6C9|nr:hypothetical protein [Myroides injenensis]
MKKILILTDYRGEFQCSVNDLINYQSMDIESIKKKFVANGFVVKIQKISEINYFDDFKGWYVLYHSSEDQGLYYKSYIQDICMYLDRKGAILLPKYYCLQAHHNKVFMELLRNELVLEEQYRSLVFGTYEEFSMCKSFSFPVIFKLAEGAGSRSVQKANDISELVNIVKKSIKVKDYSVRYLLKEFLLRIKKLFLRSNGELKREYTNYRKKFIIQPFYELEGDCKVLRYGSKYYILGRKNRINDFRASGSGIFYQPEGEELFSVLNCAKSVTEQFQENLMGLDIAFNSKSKKALLIEFQFGIFLGPYALQASKGWYSYENGKWVFNEGKSNLETEYCNAILEKIAN